MNLFESTLIIWAGAVAAGFVGALTGLGGGFIVVPLLTLLLGVDIRYAIGASLVSVIATSSGAAAAFVREGFSNIRIGMLLEIATTTGAIIAASLAPFVPTSIIGIIFGLVLLQSAYLSSRKQADHPYAGPPDKWAERLRLNGSYPTAEGPRSYQIANIFGGFVLMWFAGILSGLLGIGSGAVKVLAMDQVMHVPFKVSTATSNFMIGVTAAASAGIYLSRGYIEPALAMPVMLGVLVGSMAGAKILFKIRTKLLRKIFAVIILLLGLQLIYKGIMGGI
ncbi:sulfite exporter TauE/SafE family protein [bacterium]|nr:sulfite exporter TauE/SafE family protein [bacterium]